MVFQVIKLVLETYQLPQQGSTNLFHIFAHTPDTHTHIDMHTQAQTRTRMQYKRNSRKKVKTVRASATANKSDNNNNNKYNNKCNYLVAVICKLWLLLRLHTKIYVCIQLLSCCRTFAR